jgi:hypothetical protein
MIVRVKTLGVTLAAVCSVLCLAGSAQAAPVQDASTGQVVVFSTEFQPLTTWENPEGCQHLPAGAHVLTNQTDMAVTVYGDPFCMTPSPVRVSPGHGSHVPPTAGSFSVG